MKRDMDLIRMILLALEDGKQVGPDFAVDGYTDEQVGYHASLLMESGYALGFDMTHMGSTNRQAKLTSLTWEGHEFVDAARDQGRWSRAKASLATVGGFSLPVMQKLLTSLMKKQLGLE